MATEKSHEQRSLVGYRPSMRLQRVGHDGAHMHTLHTVYLNILLLKNEKISKRMYLIYSHKLLEGGVIER